MLAIGGMSAEGASVERRRREDRGAEVARGRVRGGGVPPLQSPSLVKLLAFVNWYYCENVMVRNDYTN